MRARTAARVKGGEDEDELAAGTLSSIYSPLRLESTTIVSTTKVEGGKGAARCTLVIYVWQSDYYLRRERRQRHTEWHCREEKSQLL